MRLYSNNTAFTVWRTVVGDHSMTHLIGTECNELAILLWHGYIEDGDQVCHSSVSVFKVILFCLRKRQNAIKTISLQLNGVKLANTYNYQLSDKVAHNGNLLPSAYTNIHIDYLYSGSNQNLVCLQQKFFHELWSSCCRTVIQRQNDRSALQSECNQLSGVSYCRKTELDNCTVLAVSFCKPSALWEWLQLQLQCCLQADCLMLERGHPEVESSTCSNSNKNQCNYKAMTDISKSQGGCRPVYSPVLLNKP